MGLGRSIVMARLLAPEDFGIVAFALVFLSLTTPLRDFGLDLALIHRKTNGKSSLNRALAVHFFLRCALMGFFVLLLLAAVPILHFLYPQRTLLVPVLLALTVGELAGALSATPIDCELASMSVSAETVTSPVAWTSVDEPIDEPIDAVTTGSTVTKLKLTAPAMAPPASP